LQERDSMDHLIHRSGSQYRIGKAFKEMTEARNRISVRPNMEHLRRSHRTTSRPTTVGQVGNPYTVIPIRQIRGEFLSRPNRTSKCDQIHISCFNEFGHTPQCAVEPGSVIPNWPLQYKRQWPKAWLLSTEHSSYVLENDVSSLTSGAPTLVRKAGN